MKAMAKEFLNKSLHHLKRRIKKRRKKSFKKTR